MTDTITLTGLVATEPRHLTTSEGLPIASFRLASTQRRYDRAKQTWLDGETNWYTITAFRQLASNATLSIKKGERVIVTGRLRIKEWTNGERTGTTVDIEAEAIGHDLTWGTAAYVRSVSMATVTSAHQASEPPASDEFPVGAAEDDAPAAADAPAAEPVGAVPF
ncbi:single-stranded DNA-binding protein [Glaciihabitans arcticus]|uniref:Single-stranded DNA-binding protein n=1 Tax=Glaciihabitans arcticus TaxID=2668039 RepID=A0A4Q9GQI8_9MICO|nr:single-stranded DNA-binding protein [Glaciihabitans arcticus]TBN57136.1 single-stranded DNA-binding protein [Glaciihabitans arcticus]